MKLVWLYIAILLIGGQLANGQNKSDYLNQNLPGYTAEVFALGIVSSSHHEHSRLEFSSDGNKMYWCVMPVDTAIKNGRPFKSAEQKIWFVEKINDKWTDPQVLEYNQQLGTSNPVFSKDGEIFYYRALVLDADKEIRPRPSQLWKVDINTKKQEVADSLLPSVKGKASMSFCFARNGNLYFDYGGPDETGEWSWNIFFSEYRDGIYQKPVMLSNKVNCNPTSWCPWIAPDESYIIYSSYHDGEYGRGDLFINFKDESGNWSDPMNMGPGVNTEMQERFPSVTPDGKYLFFARHVYETYSDIYWVDASIINQLRNKYLDENNKTSH